MLFVSCQEHNYNINKDLSISYYDNLIDSNFIIYPHKIRENLSRLQKADTVSFSVNRQLKNYYAAENQLLWVSRNGLTSQADSLLDYISKSGEMGINPDFFRFKTLRDDYTHLKASDFDKGYYNINKVLARLEYNLTRSFVIYASGLQHGFLNPRNPLNFFQAIEQDSVHTRYAQLYDGYRGTPVITYFKQLVDKISHDSITAFLHEVTPQDSFYLRLKSMLAKEPSRAMREKIACNMEKFRWLKNSNKPMPSKHVIANIPSYSLHAHDGDSVLTMRIGCGTQLTKTPLLESEIFRMDINPQWIIPRSIIENDIARHAGDVAYFEKRRYQVKERQTGKVVDLSQVNSDMLHDSRYLVVQQGGKGNSLGRIIFRFNNNFSIYLHDTSSPGVFSRESRDVSHGCIRVEKPYELAVFMLDEKDEETAARIKYSMTVDLHPQPRPEGEETVPEPPAIDKDKLVSSLNVKPGVPIYITYFTIFPNAWGNLVSYPDVYGYDEFLITHLKKYM